jgi:predicted aspartyl protease
LGFIKVRFGVFNLYSPTRIIEVEGIVDTEAIYSVIPRRKLEELDIKPVERRRFRAFGGYVERDISEVGMEILGKRRTVTVIVGGKRRSNRDRRNSPRITFGLEADPVRGTLRETELLLL